LTPKELFTSVIEKKESRVELRKEIGEKTWSACACTCIYISRNFVTCVKSRSANNRHAEVDALLTHGVREVRVEPSRLQIYRGMGLESGVQLQVWSAL
jgi:hypothetical protein